MSPQESQAYSIQAHAEMVGQLQGQALAAGALASDNYLGRVADHMRIERLEKELALLTARVAKLERGSGAGQPY